MRILLDESLPRKLVRELAPHEARSVSELGWSGLDNGTLLKRAVAAGYEVFLTADRNLEYQQNIAQSGIGVIVLQARSNRLAELRSHVPALREALGLIRRGQVLRLGS